MTLDEIDEALNDSEKASNAAVAGMRGHLQSRRDRDAKARDALAEAHYHLGEFVRTRTISSMDEIIHHLDIVARNIGEQDD